MNIHYVFLSKHFVYDVNHISQHHPTLKVACYGFIGGVYTRQTLGIAGKHAIYLDNSHVVSELQHFCALKREK